MPNLAEDIAALVGQAACAYERLVLLVGDPGSGKSAALAKVAERQSWPTVNVNLLLATKLQGLCVADRVISCYPALLDEIRLEGSSVVLLDNLEILFEGHLQQDPLRLLKHLARSTTLVAAWPGSVKGSYLTFGEAGHPDYRRYSVSDLNIFDMSCR